MARFDKYEPMTGGHRARLGFAVTAADLNEVIAVGLDANGRIQRGAGNTGVIGVCVFTEPMAAGKMADVMQDGEIVEMDVNHAGIVAGTRYFGAAADGALTTTNTDKPLGWTVEATRLVVRVGK